MWSSREWGRPRIGRDEIWQALLARRQRAVEGAGGLTLLEGGGGIGKSTFLALFAQDSIAAGFRVVNAKASWVDDPPPFRLIGDVLKALAASTQSPRAGARPPASVSAFLSSHLGSSGARARFVPMDSLGATTDDPHSELASDQLRLLGSLAEPLLTAARGSPLLVLLDDVHWSDEASRGLLLYLLPKAQSLPLWILASCTPPEAGARLRPDPLAALRARPDVDRVSLRRLDEGEVQEFVHWVLPQKPIREAEIRRLYSSSHGIPSRVMQSLLPAAGSPGPGEGAEPREVDEEAWLATLDAPARRLLNLSLVAGPEFSLVDLATAGGLDEERTVEYFEQFAKVGLIHELEDGRFAFDQDATRDRLYAKLGPRLLRGYHQKIAEALVASGQTDIKAVYSLARHTYLGGMLPEAVEYNRRAAAYAAERFQPGTSLLYLRLALEALSRSPSRAPETEIELRLEIAGQQVRQGETDAAERSLEDVRKSSRLWKATTRVERALYGVYLARVLADTGRWEEAERALGDIESDPLGEAPGDLRRSAQRLRAEILFYRADYAGALAAYESALLIARVGGNPSEIASDSIRRATALCMIPGRESEALDEFVGAIERLMDLGDTVEAAFGSLCLGAQLTVMGRTDEARQALRRSVEMSEAAHDIRRSGWAHLNLAELEFGLDRHTPATQEAQRARACFEQVDDALGIARAALTEGRLALGQGQLDLAQRGFDAARTIFRAHDLKADELEVDLRTAELELARHDELGARQRLLRILESGLVRLRPDLIEDGRRLGQRLGPPLVVLG